jgi:hypothetical protein
MEPSCTICNDSKFGRSGDVHSQITHISQRLGELENLKVETANIKASLESSMTSNADILSKQKETYIDLLKKKELLLQSVHKRKYKLQSTFFLYLIYIQYDAKHNVYFTVKGSNADRHNVLDQMLNLSQQFEKTVETKHDKLSISKSLTNSLEEALQEKAVVKEE